jgi:putative membrane protein
MKRRTPEPLLGALAGAAGGLVGAWAMVQFNHLVGAAAEGSDKEGDRYAHHREDARPNAIDGTLPDEPGTMQAASGLAEPVLGRQLSEEEKVASGTVLHYVFGAAAGALYGVAAEFDNSTTRGGGMAFGATVWLIADEVGMHAAGFATSPADYPLSRHAATLATHLVFGLTVEAARRAIRGQGVDA